MKKMGQKSQIFMKIGVILSKFSLLKGMGEVWECLNCICDVLLSSKLVLDLNLDQFWGSKRNSSPAGNWTPVSRSTGGILTTTLSRMRWRFAEFCKTLESITLHKDMGFSLKKEKVKMTKSWKILNIFLKKPSLDMDPITKVVAYAKKTLEIRGFFQWYWTWIWSRNEHFRSFHWKTGKRRFWSIEGFQRANVDILYIKVMEMDRPSIWLSEKRGFSLKNEIWWKIAFSIEKMENGP